MNDRDIDRAYEEQQAQEDLRWIANAIPHVVTLTAAFIRQDMAPRVAVKEAVTAYTLIEQALINETVQS